MLFCINLCSSFKFCYGFAVIVLLPYQIDDYSIFVVKDAIMLDVNEKYHLFNVCCFLWISFLDFVMDVRYSSRCYFRTRDYNILVMKIVIMVGWNKSDVDKKNYLCYLMLLNVNLHFSFSFLWFSSSGSITLELWWLCTNITVRKNMKCCLFYKL